VSEYDLVCDRCGKALVPMEGIVSWTRDAADEGSFALTHAPCVAAEANQREEVRRLMWPNEFLRFATDRFAYRIAAPDELRAIVWALAPFVVRHDNPAEMDGMRAASFGAIPGVKPGTERTATLTAAKAGAEVEAGK